MLLKLFIIGLSIVACRAQRLPENDCQNYFRYVEDNCCGGWHGEFTFPSLSLGTNRIDLRFSQQGTQPQSVVGALLPYPDLDTARTNIGTQRPVSFRVSLTSNGQQLPKLTNFQLNGNVLCQSTEYSPPNSYFNRFYIINVVRKPESHRAPYISNMLNFGQLPELSVNTLVYRDGVINEPTNLSWNPVRTIARPLTEDRLFNTRQRPITPTNSPRFSWQDPTPTSRAPTRDISTNVECGIEGTTMPLVHGGISIPRGRFPWLAVIYHKQSSDLNFKCGGSLVSEHIVITAAHCVDGKREHEILVWLGRHDLNSYNENGTVSRDVQDIRMHHEYNVGVFSDADIAMLTLKIPVVFSSFIKPICIWSTSEPIAIRSNERGLIAGWGKDELGNSMTRYPKMTEERLVDEAECFHSLGVSDLTSNRTLCAGNKDGNGPCMGDSGGGLMVKRNGRFLLRGVISLGARAGDQCDLGKYVVYCDLAKHIDWIMQGMK